MKRTLVVLISLMLLSGIAVAAVETVVPIEIEGFYSFLFFNNETGVAVSKLAIIFDIEVAFDASDIIVFGGGWPSMVANSTSFAFIDVEVVAGGTLQLILPEEFGGAKVMKAFWFE